MFQSYEYKACLGVHDKTQTYSWEYKIVDSEFEEFGIAKGHYGGGFADVGVVVIDVYEKRNLNVATNLIKAFIWTNKKHNHWSISELVEWNRRYNPKFAKYENDLNKYLMLL